jgi:heterodisulfide reductase subunit A2
MNTIKSTFIIKEHYPDVEVKVFYIDIRAFGKGFEDLYTRSRRMGTQYIRGLPGSVEETDDQSLRVAVENAATGKLEFHELDMLVLAQGMKPAPSTQRLQEIMGLQLTSDGFYLEAHPKLQPVDAATRGIFYAGCAEGPKDIKESVTQASAAAMRAIRLMHKGEITTEPITSVIITEKCKACGKCAEVCPYNAITVDVKNKKPAVVNSAACAGCGTCSAECRFDAISMNHFTDAQIMGQVDSHAGNSPGSKDPRLCLQLVFVCRRRLRRGLPIAVPAQCPSHPGDVFGPGGREVHLGWFPQGCAGCSGERLSYR